MQKKIKLTTGVESEMKITRENKLPHLRKLQKDDPEVLKKIKELDAKFASRWSEIQTKYESIDPKKDQG